MDPQKNDLTEQEELKILGEILEAYIDTPIEKDAFLISDLGLDSFLIVYFISEVDDRLRHDDRPVRELRIPVRRAMAAGGLLR